MDHEHFDTLARRVFTDLRRSRRAAVAGLLGAALLRHDPGAALARKDKRRAKVAAEAADRCFPGKRCTPGPGAYASRCDFSFSTNLSNKDVRGSNMSRSNFVGADLRGADFRGANVSGSCFISADLTGAKLGASVNRRGAVFCNTTMPDGSIDDSGCEGETPCCHLRVHDCPNAAIGCYARDENGLCANQVGTFPPVGTCWNKDTWRCCPCGHPDYDYWQSQCQQTFGQACGERPCEVQDLPWIGECFSICRFSSRL